MTDKQKKHTVIAITDKDRERIIQGLSRASSFYYSEPYPSGEMKKYAEEEFVAYEDLTYEFTKLRPKSQEESRLTFIQNSKKEKE